LSRSAFCKGEGIRLAQFTYWCHRFEKKAVSAQEATLPATIAVQATSREIYSMKPRGPKMLLLALYLLKLSFLLVLLSSIFLLPNQLFRLPRFPLWC